MKTIFYPEQCCLQRSFTVPDCIERKGKISVAKKGRFLLLLLPLFFALVCYLCSNKHGKEKERAQRKVREKKSLLTRPRRMLLRPSNNKKKKSKPKKAVLNEQNNERFAVQHVR